MHKNEYKNKNHPKNKEVKMMTIVGKTFKKSENKKTNYRKIAIPRKSERSYIQKENLKNEMFTELPTRLKLQVWIKNVILCGLPAACLTLFFIGLHVMNSIILETNHSLFTSTGTIQTLLIAYAVTTYIIIQKVNDHMTIYRNNMLLHKYNINRTVATMIFQNINPEENKEIKALDNHRTEYNKYILFPNDKEWAAEKQIYNVLIHSNNTENQKHAANRYSKLTIEQRKQEHVAAKSIADWKQDVFGGINEYDVMVKRYYHRSTKEVQEMIKSLSE